ncbi:uncharacterized protein EMH_0072610 [Eimeria mitis]|uniref:Uncharacterized protein n=1 Tax=Eimeria mitis TaxID=44415 RepID=U6K9G3_9EIME|nr:uncharacterized protein EMH_0072610 [Eimeria mitis]CDJ32123.1 hypothetical protein, conserved [Eimeria mitis]
MPCCCVHPRNHTRVDPSQAKLPAVSVVAFYSADIKVEVYSKDGVLLGSELIPIVLNSSVTPGTNSPTDTAAAEAFSSYAKERDHQTPLCAVQLGYTGDIESEGWSGVKIAAISLACIAGVLVLAIGGFFLHKRLTGQRASAPKRNSAQSEGKREEKKVSVREGWQ